VVEKLREKCKVVEVNVENTIGKEITKISLDFAPEPRYTAYCQFQTVEEAFSLEEMIQVENREI